ncbi:MAG TPA: hypothetical protein VGW80_12800 [Solirubrobacterales bacterium]|nr:hypothetical protein [Solirubrobacterales bacterium]
MRTAHNVAIVMLLALGVAVLPGGGNLAAMVVTALTMALLGGIAWMLYVISRENQLTLSTLTDGRRAILYGAFGLLALLVAGSDKMFSTGGGTLLWIVLLGISVAAIWKVWMEASSY